MLSDTAKLNMHRDVLLMRNHIIMRAPQVLHRTFVLTGVPALATMGVTRTQQGLAQKTLLLGTVNGQVYAVDRKLIDPRRPDRPNNKPTAEDMEEGLMPYIPQLPYMPTKYLTTNHHVRV